VKEVRHRKMEKRGYAYSAGVGENRKKRQFLLKKGGKKWLRGLL